MSRTNWTRTEVLAAMHLYAQLPFGQLHSKNPRVQQLASWLGRTPSSVAMKLCNLASLDPQIIASGRSGLAGASKMDRDVWADMQSQWGAVSQEAAAAYESFGANLGLSPTEADQFTTEELEAPLPSDVDTAGLERDAVVRVRVNQARFRRAVLASYGGRCAISGLSEPRLLVASHIVPWAVDPNNRLNPRNGLCLSALHDKAFDLGLITVTPIEHRVRIHPALAERTNDPYLTHALLHSANQGLRQAERFAPRDDFLAWHGQFSRLKLTAQRVIAVSIKG